jgi:hypothetical protein
MKHLKIGKVYVVEATYKIIMTYAVYGSSYYMLYGGSYYMLFGVCSNYRGYSN